MGARWLLTINTGSSSLKAALYRLRGGGTETLELRVEAGRIGDRGDGMRLADDRGETLDECRDYLPDHTAALDALLSRLRDRGLEQDDLAAVGHRIVHGGERHRDPKRVTPRVVDDLRSLVPIDPNHLPQAIALFCYQAKKFLGALAASLGGLDALVFTGGLGEHSATVRERVCEGLEFLGIRLDTDRNAAHARVVSGDASGVRVLIVPTDEDLMVSRHTRRLIEQEH